MFTGIIEEVGIIKRKSGNSIEIKSSFSRELKIGDSVAVNGTCLTVKKILGGGTFLSEVMTETRKKTNLDTLRVGHKANLERAMRADGRFDGHFVSGHIDTTSKIKNITSDGKNKIFKIAVSKEYEKNLVEKGSVAIDGISLTVVNLEPNYFSVSVLEFTLKHTNLSCRRAGDLLNIEFDVMAKYLWRWQNSKKN